jgi:hypothetical protein
MSVANNTPCLAADTDVTQIRKPLQFSNKVAPCVALGIEWSPNSPIIGLIMDLIIPHCRYARRSSSIYYRCLASESISTQHPACIHPSSFANTPIEIR